MGDREGRGMGDREGRPYAGLVAGLFGCRGDACRRPCRFPHGLVWVGTDAARAWHATSYEGNEAVLDSGWATARVAGWATARVAPTRASSPGCSGVGATLVVAHARFPDGLVRVGTDATRAWNATSYEGNEAVLDSGWATARVAGWATARVAGWATARVAPTRASSPGCSGVGATLVVAHARFPDGLVRVGTGAARAWHATSYEGNEAVPDSGWATARVAGWATARVAGWATARVAGWATARVAGWATARVAGWATARVAPTMGIARHHASLV